MFDIFYSFFNSMDRDVLEQALLSCNFLGRSGRFLTIINHSCEPTMEKQETILVTLLIFYIRIHSYQ